MKRRLPTHRPPTHPHDMLLNEFKLDFGFWVIGQIRWSDIQCKVVAKHTNQDVQFWINLRDDYEEWEKNND